MENVANGNNISTVIPPSTSQSSIPTHQIPADKTPNSNKKILTRIVAALLLLFVFVVIGIVIYWKNITDQLVDSAPTSAAPTLNQVRVITPTETPYPSVPEGTQVLKVVPARSGQEKYLLPDNETAIVFGQSGNSKAVPDVVFGQHYSLNDIHNINYLPIRNEVSFYNKGYFISLKNQGCNTERRFTDVVEIWVTDCSIQVTSSKAEAPIKKLEPFSRTFNTATSFVGPVNQTNNPLIYVTVPLVSLHKFSSPNLPDNLSLQIGSMSSSSETTPWNIQIISSYGIETISYSAKDVWNKVSKQVTTGPLTTISSIDNLNCKVIYRGDEGQTNEYCDVVVTLSFNQDNAIPTPIKLSSFSE